MHQKHLLPQMHYLVPFAFHVLCIEVAIVRFSSLRFSVQVPSAPTPGALEGKRCCEADKDLKGHHDVSI